MKSGIKLGGHQLWSDANPEIIIEWGCSGMKPSSHQPYWSLSIDTPNYNYYTRYMNLTGGRNMSFTKWELEDFIADNLA